MRKLAVLTFSACLIAQGSGAQSPPNAPQRLGVPQVSGAAPEVPPDNYILWQMIEKGDLTRARARYEAMREAFPDWSPPLELKHALYPPPPGRIARPKARAGAASRRESKASAGVGDAWSLYKAARYEEAAAVFVRTADADANAAYGAALSFHQLMQETVAARHAETAIPLAEAEKKDASVYRKLLGDIRLAQAQGAYGAEDFDAALGFADDVPPSHEGYEGAQRLAGWAALKAGRAARARSIFSALYEASRSEDDAQGLVLAAQALGEEDKLAGTVAASDEPLARLLARGEGVRAFYQKDFLRALRLNAPQADLLEGFDGPWAEAALRIRRIAGVPGENHLLLLEETASAGASFGRNAADASLSALQLSSKDGGGFAPGVVPRLAWLREGEVDLAGAIGTTPLGGPVDALPVGAFGARRTYARGEIMAEAYARPREESVLSFIGRFDQAKNKETGRVVAIGADLKGRAQIHPDWSLSGELLGEKLQGRNVVDNTHWRSGVSLGRLFFRETFDYFSIGPFARLEGYERNTNYYTFGHGGYFSPDFYVQSGLALNFRTPELRRSILKFDAEIAGEHVENGDAFEFPLSRTGAFLSGASSSGVSGSVAARYRRLIGDNWILGADFRLVRSAAYDDIGTGLVLRHVFSGRKALTSRDFEPLSRRKELW